MKKYALWIAEKSATGLIVGVAMAVGVISVAYAASWNGLFADVLNKIVSNGNYQTTDGTVLQATKVLGWTATDLYTSNGTTWEWTGATNVKVGDSDKVDGLHASELAGGLSAAGVGMKLTWFVTTGNVPCPVWFDDLGNSSNWQLGYEVSTGIIAWYANRETEITANWTNSAYPTILYFNKAGHLCLKTY